MAALTFYLVTYDSPNDKRRNKLADLLQNYGQRVQYSVFEVWLDGAMKRALMAKIEALLDQEEDNVRLYVVCADCRRDVIALGQGQVPKPPDVIII